MFAPNPNHFNILVEAEMEMADGQKEFVKLNSKESWKFHKILFSLNKKKQAILHPDVARYALRRFKILHPDKVVSFVHLVQLKDVIPDMQEEFRVHGEDPKSYIRERFFSYKVIP